MFSMQKRHLYLFSPSAKFISAICTLSIFSVHTSTNLSTNLFLHLQSSYSKYSPTSHDLSHLHSQLLGFQRDPLSHTPLSVNYLHLQLHLSSFERSLLLQAFASNLHLHLHVSCHFMCLISLDLDIKLNTLTFMFLIRSGTHISAYGSVILLQLLPHLLVLILK